MPADQQHRKDVLESSAYRRCVEADQAELLGLLEERTSYLRFAAVNEVLVRGLGPEFSSRMLEFCAARDYRLRSSGAYMLGCLELTDRGTLDAVLNTLAFLALRDTSLEVRGAAVYALGFRYSKSRFNRAFILSVLRKTVADAAVAVRRATMVALSDVTDKRAVPLLEQLLRDPDREIRDWTAFYLQSTRLDSTAIRDALADMLNDECANARAEAVCALARLGDSRALPALRRELDVEAETIKDIMVEAAADLGDASLLPQLEVWAERFSGDAHVARQLRRLRRKASPAERARALRCRDSGALASGCKVKNLRCPE